MIIDHYINSNISQYKTFEQWIISIEPEFQKDVFEFLEKLKKPFNYFILYTLSDTLKELPSIQKAIISYKKIALDQILNKYIFEETKENSLDNDKAFFKKPPPPPLLIDQALVANTLSELTQYQTKYLSLDSKSHAKPRLFTPKARAVAFNRIQPLLNAPSEKKLQAELLDSKLTAQIGGAHFYDRYPIVSIIPLIQWAENHKKNEEDIQQYWLDREIICKKVKDNDSLLLELLLDLDIFNSLTERELSLLFDHGNKSLFAEIIIRAYPDKPFTPFRWHKQIINITFLRGLVTQDDSIQELNRINKNRAKYNIPQYIPSGAKYTGVSPTDAALSKHELYQLIDSDITVGEKILHDEFKDIIKPIEFYNTSDKDIKENKPRYKRVTGVGKDQRIEYIGVRYDERKESSDIPDHKKDSDDRKEELPVPKSKSSLQTIYLVPINPTEAVLIDPGKTTHKHYRTYTECKNKLNLIKNSIPYSNSAIIAGICNLNAVHYVPYFIYQNAAGKVFVITIDPSHESSPLLKECFKDIFPGCIYKDVNIPQQVRQRDCGFNSLESIQNVAKTLFSENPVLSIINDKLHFDPSGLTINGEPYKAFDYERNQLFFLPEFIKNGQKNRIRWAELFKARNRAYYSADGFLEYSYEKNVEEQNTNDELDGIYSVIAGLMIQDGILNQYENQYINKLELPNRTQLEHIRQHIIKKLTEQRLEVPNEVLESENGRESIFAIFKINFKAKTSDALFNFFKNVYLPHCKIEKDSTAESILFNFTNTEKYVEFSKFLLPDQLKKLHQKVFHYARTCIEKDTFQLKEKYIQTYISTNIEILLKNIEKEPRSIENAILLELEKNEEIRKDLHLLLDYNKSHEKLHKAIKDTVNTCIHTKADYYWEILRKKPSLLQHSEIVDQKHEAINVYELEHLLQLQKEAKEDGQSKVIVANQHSSYYHLIQLYLKEKHHQTYLQHIEKQIAECVKMVILHPKNIEYLTKLTSKEQIQLSNRDDHQELFIAMQTNSDMKFSFDPTQKTLYSEFLIKQIQTQLPSHLHRISMDRYQSRYHQLMSETTLLDLKDQKISPSDEKTLQLICLNKGFSDKPFKHGETLEDFLYLYKVQFYRDKVKYSNNVAFIEKQKADILTVLTYCKTHKLLSSSRLSYYEKIHAKIYAQIDSLSQLSLFQLSQVAPDLIQKNSSLLFTIANELYSNPRYKKTATESNPYTLHAEELLCRLFNINPGSLPKHELIVEIAINVEKLSGSLCLHEILPTAPKPNPFYQTLLKDAKSLCLPDQFNAVSAFIDSISQFDSMNSRFFNSQNPLVKMNMLFKECVNNARDANQLKELFEKLSKKTKPLHELIYELFTWSEEILQQRQMDLVMVP
jgi:hypothetical protein